MAQPQMIKPEALDKLPYLDDNTKATYKTGLSNLWKQYESNPAGSVPRTEAENKIRQASARIMAQMRNGGRPVSGNGQAQQQQQQRPAQASQANGQAGQTPATAQGGNQGPQVNMQRAPSQQGQPQQQPQQGQQQQQQGQQSGDQAQVAQLQAKVKQTVNAYAIFPDPSIANQQQFEAYKQQFQQQYGNHMMKRERAGAEMSRIQRMMQAAQQNGTEIPADWKAKGGNAQTVYKQADADVKAMEAKNEQNKLAYQQKQQQNAAERQNQAQASQQTNGAQQQNAQRPSTQQGQNGEVKMENRTSNSPPQSQNQFQQQGQAQNQGTPVQQQTPQQLPQQQQQQQSQPPSAQQQSNTSQSATQPQMPQQNFPQQQQNMQQQQQQQTPQRPQLNAQQMQQHSYSQQQQQQYQAPQSAVAQNNMPNQQQQTQRPQALSQRDAIGQAQQSYTQQQTPNHSMAQQPQHPQMQHSASNANMSFNAGPPQSATQQHTPTGGQFPQQQHMSSTTKFPIPKNLTLDPRMQQPVPGPASRPTMMNQSGMLHAPGIQKPPPFTLEGEGDHVLSKRKLDELVRQITGSTSPADGLAPEVEESVLSLADDFVDKVITGACQLAKLRTSGTLDLRDVQMVLERNYGIRIPGYSLDEVRTVRKFQPAAGWVGKVQAVQAGKVMGGGKDA